MPQEQAVATQVTPQEFAAKIKTKYPAYASVPDDQLVEKITAKYPQYKAQIKQATPAVAPSGPDPQRGAAQATGLSPDTRSTAARMWDEVKRGLTSAQAGQGLKPQPTMIANAAQFVGMAGDTLSQLGVAPEAAEAGGAVERLLTPRKVDPLAKMNKLLGVGAREVRVGSVPESLSEFASNPGRGVVKAGLDEKALAKMDPLQRNKVVTEARNEVGKQLDQMLKAASDSGKKVDVSKPVADAFKKIADPAVAKNAEVRLQQILTDNGITHPLSQLTPSEARVVQRGLEGFDREVATDLRRGISAATRKVVPESAELDMQYGDLAGAVKGTNRVANKYARTVPESKLRMMIKKGIKHGAGPLLGAGATGAAYEYFGNKTTHVP